jgi:DNA primase
VTELPQMDKFAPLTSEEIAAAHVVSPDARDAAERIAKAKGIVLGCCPIAGTIAETYLAARGIDVSALPNGVAGWHKEDRALVIPIRKSAAVTACSRLFFDKRGNPRLREDGKKYRLINGILTGSALCLPGNGDILICEGAEDGFSLWQSTHQPVCVAFGTSNLGSVPLPDGAPVIIVADNDEPKPDGTQPGIEEAKKAAARLTARGHPVRIAIPPDGCKDANDVLIKHGENAVRALVSDATIRPPHEAESSVTRQKPRNRTAKARACC